MSERSRRDRDRLPRSIAALFIERNADAVRATANRYSVSREDAEDAYQRGLEILLTKGPNLPEEELLRWVKTVVKHEAFAIWRGRDRVHPVETEGLERAGSTAPPPHEHVESHERLAVGAEAIAKLKPQEIRCLLLRADGLSYRQICEATGWTYTKVNRCLTEGRRRFLDLVAGIEAGAECDRLAPLLSAMVDGEATAEQMAELRPHLRSCLACRATLRAFRAIPHQAAALVPFGLAGHADRVPRTVAGWVDSAVAWVQERCALVGAKITTATEMASATKVAALAASTAVLAGGAAALQIDESTGAGPDATIEPAEPLIAGEVSATHAVGPRSAPRPIRAAEAGPVDDVHGHGGPSATPSAAAAPPRTDMEEAAGGSVPSHPAYAAADGGESYGGEPPDPGVIAEPTGAGRPASRARRSTTSTP